MTSWTPEQLKAFDDAIEDSGSSHQVTRIAGRMEISRIVKELGRPLCDAMFAHLEAERARRKAKGERTKRAKDTP